MQIYLSRQILLSEVSPLMEEILKGGGKVSFTPRGNSMHPMLRNHLDKIILVQAPAKLKKYDIPLYRRHNGQFVLHRVVAVKEDGYVLCGDNQIQREYGIRHHQVMAVVKAFYHRGKYIDCHTSNLYRLYCITWVALTPLRRILFKLRAFASKARRKPFEG